MASRRKRRADAEERALRALLDEYDARAEAIAEMLAETDERDASHEETSYVPRMVRIAAPTGPTRRGYYRPSTPRAETDGRSFDRQRSKLSRDEDTVTNRGRAATGRNSKGASVKMPHLAPRGGGGEFTGEERERWESLPDIIHTRDTARGIEHAHVAPAHTHVGDTAA